MNTSQLKQRFEQITGAKRYARNVYLAAAADPLYMQALHRAVEIFYDGMDYPSPFQFDFRTQRTWSAYIAALEEMVGE